VCVSVTYIIIFTFLYRHAGVCVSVCVCVCVCVKTGNKRFNVRCFNAEIIIELTADLVIGNLLKYNEQL
jgi:hypothetical protein